MSFESSPFHQDVRKHTNRLIDLCEEGSLDLMSVISALTGCLSDDDIHAMAKRNELFFDYDEDFDYLSMDLESDLDGD